MCKMLNFFLINLKKKLSFLESLERKSTAIKQTEKLSNNENCYNIRFSSSFISVHWKKKGQCSKTYLRILALLLPRYLICFKKLCWLDFIYELTGSSLVNDLLMNYYNTLSRDKGCISYYIIYVGRYSDN